MKEFSAKSREVYELMTPAVDMFEEGSDLVVVFDLPGFEKSRIKTRLHEHSLIVSAKREKEERDGVIYWEQRPLTVHKRVLLPVKIKYDEDGSDQLVAKYENGVLTVRLPIKDVGKITVQ